METIAKSKMPRIERGRTEIVVPHEGSEIIFDYLSYGCETYFHAGKRIIEQGMNVPTGDQMASLLYFFYYEGVRKWLDDITDQMDDWLWVFNRNLWTREGVYVVQDSEAIGLSQQLNQTDLEKMLEGGKDLNGIRFSKDGRVRFASKRTYQLEEHSPESLTKDGFIVASYGIEGAEKLGKVSAIFGNKPCIYGLKTRKPEQTLSVLDDDGSPGGGRFRVRCDFFDGNHRFGHAFGVLK